MLNATALLLLLSTHVYLFSLLVSLSRKQMPRRRLLGTAYSSSSATCEYHHHSYTVALSLQHDDDTRRDVCRLVEARGVCVPRVPWRERTRHQKICARSSDTAATLPACLSSNGINSHLLL